MRLTHFDLLTLRKPTIIDELFDSVKKPKGTVPKKYLPTWNELEIEHKLPLYKIPKECTVFTREKIGRKLWKKKKSNQFVLQDPHCYEYGYQYDALHDEHLRPFFSRKPNHDYMLKLGLINDKEDVICTLKQFNEYRRYLRKMYSFDVNKKRVILDEMDKDNRRLWQSDQFFIKDLEVGLEKNARQERMREIQLKYEEEAHEKLQRHKKYHKVRQEQYEKYLKRKEEENRQRIVKARLLQDKIRNRIAMGNEIRRRKRIVSLRNMHCSDIKRHQRNRREQIQNKRNHEKWLADNWDKRMKYQLENLRKKKHVMEKFEENKNYNVAERTKAAQEEKIRREEYLAAVRIKNRRISEKYLTKLCKEDDIAEAVNRALRKKKTSLLPSDSRTITDSVHNAVAQMKGNPAMTGVYHVLEGTKANLQKSVHVPEQVKYAIDSLLDKTITHFVEKSVQKMLDKVFITAGEDICPALIENKKRSSSVDQTKEVRRHSPASLSNVGSKVQSISMLQKKLDSFMKVERGVSFGASQIIANIDIGADRMLSTKDRPPTPTPSITDLADAVFKEPIVISEGEAAQLNPTEQSLKTVIDTLSKHFLKFSKQRTEKSLEQKQKLLYNPNIAYERKDLIQQLTRAVLNNESHDIMNCEEVQNTIDYFVRAMLRMTQMAKEYQRSGNLGSITIMKSIK